MTLILLGSLLAICVGLLVGLWAESKTPDSLYEWEDDHD